VSCGSRSQAARERVYDLFNSLNSHDEFNIHCYNVPRTGTRIPQRVCRPQYTDTATMKPARSFSPHFSRSAAAYWKNSAWHASRPPERRARCPW
jgi:hypothetical protein